MCGLVGVVGGSGVVPVLLDGLRRLEYRGYDSAGLALLNGALHVRRCVGSVRDLARVLEATGDPHLLSSPLGIGHTRWATHGEPHERNAHPHVSRGEVAVVHNGVIANHGLLRRRLRRAGYDFESETDSEVVAHLVHRHLERERDLFAAVQAAVRELEGAYAIAVVSSRDPAALVVARRRSPLVVGVGEERQFVASDPGVLLPWTRHVIYPEEGDVVLIRRDDVSVAGADRRTVIRPLLQVDRAEASDKGPYRHYMLKEIHEQPRALADTLEGRVLHDRVLAQCLGLKAPALFKDVCQVQLLGCGSSLHAAEAGQWFFRRWARLPTQLEEAGAFAVAAPRLAPGTLVLALSQSGETGAVRAAIDAARAGGAHAVLAVGNVPDSAVMRAADLAFPTRAGPELSIPATKTFSTQILSLQLIALLLTRRRRGFDERRLVRELRQAAAVAAEVLDRRDALAALAAHLSGDRPPVFLAAGGLIGLAREAALKCSETGYLPCRAFGAGELRHGPLAALQPGTPLVAFVPDRSHAELLKEDLEAACAARLRLYLLGPQGVLGDKLREAGWVVLPAVSELLQPFAFATALQLLAYQLGLIRGTDIDQPRHLQKAVQRP